MTVKEVMTKYGKVGTIYVVTMRHGDKLPKGADGVDPDKLSPLGERQVATATEALRGVAIDRVYFSGMGRARQTCEIVLKVLGITAQIFRNLGFGFAVAMKRVGGRCKTYETVFAELEAATKQQKRAILVEDWLKAGYLPTVYLMGQVTTAILTAVKLLQKEQGVIFVGCHNLVAEAGCLDPAHTPSANVADMYVYVCRRSSDDGKGPWEIVAMEYIACSEVK